MEKLPNLKSTVKHRFVNSSQTLTKFAGVINVKREQTAMYVRKLLLKFGQLFLELLYETDVTVRGKGSDTTKDRRETLLQALETFRGDPILVRVGRRADGNELLEAERELRDFFVLNIEDLLLRGQFVFLLEQVYYGEMVNFELFDERLESRDEATRMVGRVWLIGGCFELGQASTKSCNGGAYHTSFLLV